MTQLDDALHVLQEHLSISDIMSLISKTARWVDPETFKALPVWYPEYARKNQLFKADWETKSQNKTKGTQVFTYKKEGNVQANKALTDALGLEGKHSRQNWSCCHIWGVDDPTYQMPNEIVQDHRFYSCVANMVLLPSPLKAFTDMVPEVKVMLRICAGHMYEWQCDHQSIMHKDYLVSYNDAYPRTWPARAGELAPGIMPLNNVIKSRIEKRKSQIRKDLKHAGSMYPTERVLEAIAYWEKWNGFSLI